jgi:GxxExxY protein
MLHKEITDQIIKSFYKVYNKLGYGFLEKVYERSLIIELRKLGLECKSQEPMRVFYEEKEVGFYLADILVEDLIVIELKAAVAICEEHEFQLINYLRASEKEIGILLNVGKTPQFKRKIFSKQNIKS